MENYLEVGDGATLTIEPGVVVKFDDNSMVDVYGKIIARGTPQDKIYFTSFLDDSVGGDTNGDGSATEPDNGDWFGMSFYSPSAGSDFEYSDFKYASDPFYLDSSSLKLASSTVSLSSHNAIYSTGSNLEIRNNHFNNDNYAIETKKGNLVLYGNSFTNNDLPAYIDYQTFLDNGGNSMSDNENNGIGLYGTLYRVDSDKTIHKDVPYILFDYLTINKGTTMTIEPGVVVKSYDYSEDVSVYGKLKAVGTEEDPIIFTSFRDDSAGGDTNGDRDASSPDPWGRGSDWNGFYFGQFSGDSEIKNVSIKYANDVYFDSVDLTMDKVDIENGYDATYIYNGKVKIKNSTFKDNKNALIVYKGSLDLTNSDILNTKKTAGVNVWEAKEVNIANNRITGSYWNGIYLDSASTTISGNFITKNYLSGIYMGTSAPAKITGNDIYSNSDSGIFKGWGIETINVDARDNWWGDKSGPYNAVSNPGGKGGAVSDGVIFAPWLDASIKKPTGFSNVAFIPGIQASRIYQQGLLFENQLWEPNWNNDVRKMFMDKDGKSADSGIYTRDIIKETNVPFSVNGLGLNIYKKFSESMDKLVASSTINAWKALSYDWRFDLSDIVGGGAEGSGGNISFINPKPEGQLPYMILELEKLAKNSKNGKVTIITHSNGGLVAKALLKKLAEMKESGESDLIGKIDRLIMVAAPEIGTPQAVVSMLHGDGQELGFGFILNSVVAREFAENMLGAYNLLPSEKYFSLILSPMVKFDPSVDKVNNWRLSYGGEISDYAKLKDFLLGKEGRAKPSSDDVGAPNVLSAKLLPVSQNNHLALDDWQIPANIEVTQIAGWGLDTVSGIKYLAKEECSPNLSPCVPVNVLDHEPIFTNDGDETVVSPSATAMDGKIYYFNIAKQNEGFHSNLKHKNILEAQTLQGFIKNIITNSTSTIPDYLTSEKPEPASTGSSLRLSVHSPVLIDIYDDLGNHTGLIPNPDPNSDLELAEENIPNSYYVNFGEGKYAGFDSGSQNKVELKGTGIGTFTLNIGEYIGDKEATSTAFIDIPVTPLMTGEMDIKNLDVPPELKIDADGDGATDFSVKPGAEFDPVMFLEIMKKTIMTFNLDKGAETSFINRINNLIKTIKKGNIKQAGKKIKGFISSIKPIKGHSKKISKEEKEAILNMLNQLLINIK